MSWLDEVRFDDNGLIPAIAQDVSSGRILMVAWMNRTALEKTVQEGVAVYWSRSRQALWHKGESSGHTQRVHDIRLDCDADVILLTVEQIGQIACHTGRESCFYQQLVATAQGHEWKAVDPVLKDPKEIYR
ncbi:phosphoribosyl-AMP cyclohydrolase [Orrella sp. 11846]|uniref:phosphoribosyl-AMP cyclohydrolase n=1 Tax=Orrella sp. 11846 TaxID=3409913 RepID=UPI003B5A8D51